MDVRNEIFVNYNQFMISVIIPFYNERKNLSEVIPALQNELHALGDAYEIILVDDGSSDMRAEDIDHVKKLSNVQLIRLGRRMGKGKALAAGLARAKGAYIVFMDADFQDDPADLKVLYAKLQEGFDLVNGYRHDRKDTSVIKWYSGIARWVLQSYLNSPFSDINCGFKIFRKELLEKMTLYGNNFRFFPLAAFYEGYRVSEAPVHNRPRLHGVSKFGARKLFTGMLDMLSAYFLYRFSDRPLHFFGPIGAVFFLLGGAVLTYITYERIFLGVLLYRRPALQYSIFLVILGIQIIMTGILSELIVYMHKSKRD